MKIYEATEQAYKNGYEAGKPKWISVEERLPEMYKNVLVIRTDGKIRLDAIGSLSVWYEEVWHTGNPITHWMPLPEPPKGE